MVKLNILNYFSFTLLSSTKEKIVQALVTDITENGLIVKLPNGDEELVNWEDLTIYKKLLNNVNQSKYARMIGTYINLLMIKKNGDLIISRAKYLRKELEKIQIGDKMVVTVTSGDNGAIYVETPSSLVGKIYSNQLTSSKIRKPLDIYNVGDNITVKVKKIREDGYIEFSRIDLYKGKEFQVKIGEVIPCRITDNLLDGTGQFAESIDNPNYSGIVDKTPGIDYKIGDVVNLMIKDIDGKHLKLRTA